MEMTIPDSMPLLKLAEMFAREGYTITSPALGRLEAVPLHENLRLHKDLMTGNVHPINGGEAA